MELEAWVLATICIMRVARRVPWRSFIMRARVAHTIAWPVSIASQWL